jgi:hypothetical protein
VSMGLRRSANGRGRRAMARSGGEAPASNLTRGRTGNRAEKGQRGSSPQGGALAAAAERRGDGCDSDQNAAAMAAAARASGARGSICGFNGF